MGCAKQRVGQGRTTTGTRVELQLTWSQWKHSFLTLIFIASEIVSLLMKETSGSSYGGRNYFACRLTLIILGHSWTRLNRKSCQSSFQNLSTATVLVSPWQPDSPAKVSTLITLQSLGPQVITGVCLVSWLWKKSFSDKFRIVQCLILDCTQGFSLQKS